MAAGKNQSLAKMSPRQKMINLMYIVLTAMLALNVSNDVLNGFSQVEEGLKRSNRTITSRNLLMMNKLQDFYNEHPEEGDSLLNAGNQVRNAADELYNFMDSLKTLIVKQADGPEGDVSKLKNKDDIDAATTVMLSPDKKLGTELRMRFNQYKDFLLRYIDDPDKRKNIEASLSTEPYTAKGGDIKPNQTWEESLFESMPAVAALTLLTKLQNDVRYSEGEALRHLLSMTNISKEEIDDLEIKTIDVSNLIEKKEEEIKEKSEIKVNWMKAFVIPESNIVMRGSPYKAQIVLAAIDSTQRPTVYVNGARLNSRDGTYEVNTSTSGTFDYSGHIEVVGRDGQVFKRDFRSSYTVIDPVASVSATMMNVFYAGIDNPVSITVPGVNNSTVSATMTNGTLTKSGNGWIARPAQPGTECVVTVSVSINGVTTNVGSSTFKARKLPDPTPYINLGQDVRYKGGKPIAKSTLLGVGALHAAIDDGLLDIEFQVLSFETHKTGSLGMGETLTESSAGNNFSDRQKAAFRNMRRGEHIFISGIKARGPDGVTRTLQAMDIIVN